MVAPVDIDSVATMIDPAAGEGALLRSARARWPQAHAIAADIAVERVRALAKAQPGWHVVATDFLRGSDVADALARAPRPAPRVVLLNPPFSGRGGKALTVRTGPSQAFRGSRAMAFLVAAARLATDEGQLVAVVPAGLLTSERDEAGRSWLERHGALEELARPGTRTFRGVVATTAIVRWTSGRKSIVAVRQRPARLSSGLPITRGTRQMHAVAADVVARGTRLIHTTNLRHGRIVGSIAKLRPKASDRLVAAPAVLIPRVGLPDPRKIVVLATGSVILSDCVFGIGCRDTEAAHELRAWLLANFELARASYGGTAASYLTLAGLSRLLAQAPRPLVGGLASASRLAEHSGQLVSA